MQTLELAVVAWI